MLLLLLRIRYTENELDCCSRDSIGFHYINASLMYRMDALLYGCRRDPAYVVRVAGYQAASERLHDVVTAFTDWRVL